MVCDYSGADKNQSQPEVVKKEGKTYVNAQVYWQTPLRCAVMFSNACQQLYDKYQRKMALKPINPNLIFGEGDCKSALETVCAAASINVEIAVEGMDKIAEKIAKQLYAGLKSVDCFNFDMKGNLKDEEIT